MQKIHKFSSDEKLKWFGYGEWVEEPDEVEWIYRDFQCLIKRIVFPDGFKHVFGGYLCGYILLIPGHPWFDVESHDIDCDVHCGLSFDEKVNENLRMIGFDCAHAGDYAPSLEIFRKGNPNLQHIAVPEEYKEHFLFNPIYRNVDYCIQQCQNLVDQAIEAQKEVKNVDTT